MKGYEIFRKCIIAIVLVLFILIGYGSIYNLSQINIGGDNDKVVMFTFGSFISVLLLLFIVLIFRFIEHANQKRYMQYVITGTLFVIMTVIFFVLLQKFDVQPRTDSFDILDEAMYLLNHSKVTMDNVHIVPMGEHGNNYFLIIMIRYLYQLLFYIGITDVLSVLYGMNVAAIMLGVFLPG